MNIAEVFKRFDPENTNKHTPESVERMTHVLKYQGFDKALIISNNTQVLNQGHKRAMAAKKLGQKWLPVTFRTFDTIDQEKSASISDNATGQDSEIDMSIVNKAVLDFDSLTFDPRSLGLVDFEPVAEDKYTDKDAVEIPETNQNEMGVQTGDLWILGEHRLLCGDATNKDDVERLMNGEKADMVYTDPPYGISLNTDYASSLAREKDDSGRNHRNYKAVHGDENEFDPSKILNYFKDCKEIFLFGANYFIGSIPGYRSGSWIVWLRAATEGMESQPGTHFELCWSKHNHQNLIARIAWKGAAGHSIKDDGDKKTHPTQKPVKLAEWFFDKWGKDKTNIVDLYLGSGSTVIACEKTNRKCFGMEIDPHYCSVIIKRWEKFSGQKAIKQGE